MRCPVCEEEILLGQEVQRIPAPQRVAPGPKTGLPGLYAHENFEHDEEDIVHFPQCCMGYFSPEDNPYIYDAIEAEVRERLEEELKQELIDQLREDFDRVRHQVGEKNYEFCVDCWAKLDNEEEDEKELICLWCKRTDTVWTRNTPSGPIHYCALCTKLWNADEEEVRAA